MQRIALVTDAWCPQINGVVTTLTHTVSELERLGHEVLVIHPGQFRTAPLPSYPEIKCALLPGWRLRRQLDAFAPQAIHIATEGPLGLAARRYCRRHGLRFTTSLHTRFPEYVRLRLPFVPLAAGYAFLSWFHGGATRTLVSNPAMAEEMRERGIANLALWSRGTDTETFRPDEPFPLEGERPVFMYMGRVAPEKNIEAFLKLDLPGTKYVIGDGPSLASLRRRYPAVRFTGYRTGRELARHVAAADVFVFPSRTDTLGLVMLEAMACGVPVAAYPVLGPNSVVKNGETGCLHEDLRRAALRALDLDRRRCREAACARSWRIVTREFVGQLVSAHAAALNTAGELRA
ncbi:MAG: glycosyltransferase family 1 protein [Nitrococcus sp.]|nr:glycosyltransferase family 1 protein [Nitrococcus sp.]